MNSAPSGSIADRVGTITSVRGSVVDIRFDESLPPIYSVLHAGEDGKIIIEVLSQSDSRHVRSIALAVGFRNANDPDHFRSP